MLGRGDDDGVDFFDLEEFFGNGSDLRRGAIGLCIEGDGAIAIDGPEIADGDHLDVFGFAELSDHAIEFGAAAADADVADGDAIVGAGDAAVGERSGAGRGGRGGEQGSFLNEFAATDFAILCLGDSWDFSDELILFTSSLLDRSSRGFASKAMPIRCRDIWWCSDVCGEWKRAPWG